MIAKDKVYHFAAGLSVFAMFYPLGHPVAFLVVVLVAAFKEFWDLSGRGTPEFMDFVTTILGAVCLALWYGLFL